MKIKPLHDRVVVRRIDEEERTPGGVIIPDTAKEKPMQGEVLAVGPGARDEAGKRITPDVKEGDTIKLDDNLVSMETAKAVVDVPSPVSGKVLKLAGGAGDVIVTGTMLAEFEVDPSMPQRAEGQDTGHHHGGGHGVDQRDVGVGGDLGRPALGGGAERREDRGVRQEPHQPLERGDCLRRIAPAAVGERREEVDPPLGGCAGRRSRRGRRALIEFGEVPCGDRHDDRR